MCFIHFYHSNNLYFLFPDLKLNSKYRDTHFSMDYVTAFNFIKQSFIKYFCHIYLVDFTIEI